MTVYKTFFTKDGEITRELTEQEVIKFAKGGDFECLKELFKTKWVTLTTDAQRIEVIKKLLIGEVIG